MDSTEYFKRAETRDRKFRKLISVIAVLGFILNMTLLVVIIVTNENNHTKSTKSLDTIQCVVLLATNSSKFDPTHVETCFNNPTTFLPQSSK